MPSVTGRDLIYQTILDQRTDYFKVSDIVQETGIVRQRVGECVRILCNEGILERDGYDYFIADQNKLVKFMLKRAGLHETKEALPSRLMWVRPEGFNNTITAIIFLRELREGKEWRPVANQLLDKLEQDIEISIESLQKYRTELRGVRRINQSLFYRQRARMANSTKYHAKLETAFITMVERFLGIKEDDLSPERVFSEYIKPAQDKHFKTGDYSED